MERVRFPIDGVIYRFGTEFVDHVESGAWIWLTFGNELRTAAREQPDRLYIIADGGVLTLAAHVGVELKPQRAQ